MTDRGLRNYGALIDASGSLVTVRESSLATDRAVWIFCKSADDRDFTPQLTVPMAVQVIASLVDFVAGKDDGDD